jgi:hypothetical protein
LPATAPPARPFSISGEKLDPLFGRRALAAARAAQELVKKLLRIEHICLSQV